MKFRNLVSVLISGSLIFTFSFVSTAHAANQVVPDFSETFVPEIKSVRAWLAGGERSMTFHLKLEIKVKNNSIWRVVSQLNAIPKSDRVTCQIPNRIEVRGEGGTPETGYAQAIPNEKRTAIDAEYSVVAYEFESTSRVEGNGFPICQTDYFLAYLAVYSTSDNYDSYSLPYDAASKRILPLINVSSTWANWYPDKMVPPCQEPVRSDNYGVAWRTACQIKFTWPTTVLIESNKSSDDLAAEAEAKAFLDSRRLFDSALKSFETKIQSSLSMPGISTAYRPILMGYLNQANSFQISDQLSLNAALQLMDTWDKKVDGLLVKIRVLSITCSKGKTTKIVKGSNPKCPAGYKKK